MDVIVYNDPTGNVVAYTPPDGMTAEEAQKGCPQPSWIVDNATLPVVPIGAWVLTNGVVMVDVAKVAAFSVPQSITNAQLKRQLDADGRLQAAKAAIAQADGLAEELWNGAAVFLRNDPLLIGLATAIGYDTAAKIDAFFTAAAKL